MPTSAEERRKKQQQEMRAQKQNAAGALPTGERPESQHSDEEIDFSQFAGGKEAQKPKTRVGRGDGRREKYKARVSEMREMEEQFAQAAIAARNQGEEAERLREEQQQKMIAEFEKANGRMPNTEETRQLYDNAEHGSDEYDNRTYGIDGDPTYDALQSGSESEPEGGGLGNPDYEDPPDDDPYTQIGGPK